ncbi:hypothetical protein V9T40_002411 [Parthenolecanium corni]|uniref:Uncharacterized protein n=1 Tax=Parthenolecanium corni TaxID=536013 RepID=A0AAN9TKR0_9HEMI
MFGCHNRILQSQNYTPQWHVYCHIGCPIIGFSNPTIGCPIIGLGNPTIGHPTCYTINATLGHPTVIAMSGTDSGMRFVRPKNRCGIADHWIWQSYNRPRL